MVEVIEIPVDHLPLQEVVGGRGGVITEWLRKRNYARAAFRIRIRQLAKSPPHTWPETEYKNVGDGLWEIKWKGEGGVPHRAAGFWHKGQFVMLVGFTHKGKVYDPEDWKKIALRHKREFLNEERGSIAYSKE